MHGVRATADEVRAELPGDDVVPAAQVVMDRGFDLPGTPAEVWPWLVQLGKGRAGWYLPAAIERMLPERHRALRVLDRTWLDLRVGAVVPDYGGAGASFTVEAIQPPHVLVYSSVRRHVRISWALVLRPDDPGPHSRLHLRLRLAGLRRPWLARTAGEAVDAITIAAMAAGLRERLTTTAGAGTPAL